MDRWNGVEVNGLNGKRDLSEQSNGDGCWAEARRCCDVSEESNSSSLQRWGSELLYLPVGRKGPVSLNPSHWTFSVLWSTEVHRESRQ